MARLSFEHVIQDTIKQRLRASLLVGATSKTVLDTAADLAGELTEDGAWEDLDAAGDPAPGLSRYGHLHRTLLLAKARPLAPSELGGPTRRALDWWLSQDLRSADWRRDQIAVPRLVGEIALLCDDDLSLGAWGKVLEILARCRWADWVKGEGWVEWTGDGLLGVAYNIILRACLEGSASLCDTAFRRVFRSVRWTHFTGPDARPLRAEPPPDGLQRGSLFLAQDYARLIALAYGTPWQAPTESVKSFVTYLLDFQQWTMRQSISATLLTDSVPSPDHPDPRALAESITQLAQLGNPPRRGELAALAERLHGRGTPLSGHRYVWRSQFAVHQRPAFYASLRLAGNIEAHREVAPIASPPAGGTLYFLRHGLEYAGMAHRWNLRLLPGLTAIQKTGSFPTADRSSGEFRRLVGGVSEGDCGIAALELTDEGLHGKKAWFFFEDAVVGLDAGLHGPAVSQPVFTSVNQCRLYGPVQAEDASGRRVTLAPDEAHDLTAVRQVEHDGFLYYFPGSLRVAARLEASPGDEGPESAGSKGILSLWIDHGLKPAGAASAYLVVPSDAKLPGNSGALKMVSEIQILANSSAVQAVRHRNLGLLGVVFWEPGVVSLPDGGRVAANRACLLLIRDGATGHPTLSVSNPARQPATVHVEYGGRCLAFDLPGGDEAGRSVSRQL